MANSDGEVADEVINTPSSGEFSPTSALSNRLGYPDIVDNPNMVEQLLEPQNSSALELPSLAVIQATEEPVFSERTSTRLDLAGESPNDPSRKRLALGDFDNDGNEDVLLARWEADVQLFMNQAGVLVLSQSVFTNLSDLANARHVGVADVNADGWQDLIIRNKLLLNLGENGGDDWLGFGSGVTITGAEIDPFTIQTADFDGDGDIDAVTSPGQRMLVNDGSGNLGNVASRMGSNTLLNVIKFDALDFDGDGDIDMAGPETSEQNHFIFFNDGAGNFPNSLRFSLPIDTLTYTEIGADFNDDGIADFRIYADNELPRAFMSNGNFVGGFPQYVKRIDADLFGDNGKHGLAHIRDIDADGDLDYILSSLELFIDRVDSLNEKTEIIVNEDINAGTFSVFADPEWRDEESFDAKILDVNLDGNMDLFIAHQGRLAVYINDAAPLTVEITGQSNTPSEVAINSDFSISVSGNTNGIVTTWDMGDGNTINSGSNLSVSHSYSIPGRYLVTVNVDNGVASDSIVFWHTVFETQTNPKPMQSTTIVYEDLGDPSNLDRVWSVNPDHNQVSAVLAGSGALLSEIAVGPNPSSLAFGGDGQLYVVNKDDSTISVIDTSSLSVVQTNNQLPSASQAHGIVFGSGSNTAYISLEATGELAKLDFSTNTLNTADVGPTPRELGITGNGSTLYVSRFITPQVPGEDSLAVSTTQGGGEVRVIRSNDLSVQDLIILPFNNKPDAETSSRGIPNYLMAPIMSPSGNHAYVPANISNIYRGQFRDGNNREHNKLVRSMLAKLDIQNNTEVVADRHDFDNSAQPTAGAFDPTGNYLYLVFEASRKLRVYDVYAGAVLDSKDLGFAPRGVTVSPDGTRIYIDNFLSRSLHIFDATPFVNGDSAEHIQVIESPKVSSEPLAPAVLLGKQLFFDAADERLSAQSYISCATCHADGGHDGRTWDFSDVGEGLRNTIDLRGRSGVAHGFVHWTANFDEIQDFENDIRDIFQGTGLMTNVDFSNTSATLGNAKGGLSSDLDALAAYIATLDSPGQSPYRDAAGNKTAEAITGQQVFNSSNCALCHSGPTFTDSINGGSFSDIGTVDADTGGRLGGLLVDGGLDTPTLRGLWHGAPYLHDGSAPTVAAAILAHESPVVGFDVSSLSANELTNLEQYLLQIGSEDIANVFPTANAGPDMTVVDIDNDGQENVELNASLSSDSDGAISNFSWISDTGVSIPDGEISNADFAQGVHQITLTISDDNGAVVTDTLIVTVTANNNLPPQLSDPGAQSNFVGDNVSLQLAATDPDAGEVLSYSAIGLPAGLVINQQGSGVISGTPTTVGSSNVSIQVDDGNGGSDTLLIVWTILALPNQAPVANAGSDQTIVDADDNGSEVITLSAAASFDNDGTIASYQWSSDSGVVIGDGVNPSASFSVGVHTVTLLVSDDDGAAANDTVTITVTEAPNNAPVLTNPGAQVNFMGDTVSLTLSASDADAGETLTYSATDLPSGLVIDASSGLISGVVDTLGVSNVTLGVSDGNGGSDSVNIDWTVQAVSACTIYNSADTPIALPDQTASISSNLVATVGGLISDLNVTVDMPHAWPGDLTMTLTNQQTGTSVVMLDRPGVPAAQWGCENDDVLATFDDDGTLDSETVCSTTPPALAGNFLPASPLSVFNQEEAGGTWTLQIDDAYVQADSGTLNAWSIEICTQGPGNQAPVANAGADQTLVDNDGNGIESVSFDGTASNDLDGSIVSYDWTSDTGIVIPSGASATADLAVGVHNITLTVTDNEGVSATDTLIVRINALPNEAPTADAGSEQTLLDTDDSGAEVVNLNASLSADADGSLVSYVWSSDTGITIPDGEISSASFPVGVHNVSLIVTDNDGATASDSVLITINALPNVAPVANAGADQQVVDSDNSGAELINLSGSSSADSDGTIINFVWSTDSGITIPTGVNTAADFAVGSHLVTLTVTDNEGATASDTVAIVVEQGPNQAPVANAGSDQTIVDADDNGSEVITLSATASFDNDGTIASYQWSSDSGVVIGDGVNPSASFPIGVHTVTLLVSDDDGAAANDTVTITVTEAPNNAPVLTNPGAQVNFMGDTVSLTLSASDADAGETLTYSATDLPSGLVIDASSGLISGVVDTLGVSNVTLGVSDSNGGSDSVNIDWTVQAVSACTIYNSADTPIALPDQTASISSNLVATVGGLISDLKVTVDMPHAWPGDLTMTLTNQQTGTSVVMLDRPGVPAAQWGCENDDVLATFDDDGTLDSETVCSATPPALAGNFLPASPLSVFNQEEAGGTWTLQIDDAYVQADSGTLSAWSVEICTQGPGNQAPVANAGVDQTLVDNDGNGIESVAFDGSVSIDLDGSIVSYDWTSDTGIVIPSGASVTADFAVGVHNITLTVTDNEGATAIDNMIVIVQDPLAGTCSVEESFESGASGWLNVNSSCATGAFVAATPSVQENGGVTTQVGGDHTTGAGNAFFTATNTSAGADDVDGGECVAESPIYTVANDSTLSIWNFHGQRDAGDDATGDYYRLEMSLDGGSVWSDLASNGDQTQNAAWAEATSPVAAGSQVKIRIRVSDGVGAGDLIEAGIDDLSICQ